MGESYEKRQRERRKQEKRRDKALRKQERATRNEGCGAPDIFDPFGEEDLLEDESEGSKAPTPPPNEPPAGGDRSSGGA